MQFNSSNSTPQSYTILLNQGLYIAHLTLSYLTQPQLIFGIIGVLFAPSTIITIMTSKQLRTRNYFLIIGVAVGDLIYALHFIRLGVVHLVWEAENTLQFHLIETKLECLIKDIPRAFAPALCKGFFCLCAIDRFLAVYKPHWYNSSYPTWLFPATVAIAVLQAAFDVFILLIFVDKNALTPACSYVAVSDSDVLIAISAKNNVTVAISVVVYLVTIITVYVKLGKVKKHRGNVDEARREMQTKAIWTLAVMLGGFVSTTLVAAVVYKILYLRPLDVQARYSVITNTFQQLNPLMDFCILIWKNKDFRTSFLKWSRICKKENVTTKVIQLDSIRRSERTLNCNEQILPEVN